MHIFVTWLRHKAVFNFRGRYLLVDIDMLELRGAGARDVMLLQLWAQLFPVSDRRHPVTTPLALLTSSYLALCPVTSCHAAAVGKQHISTLFQPAAAVHRRCVVCHPVRWVDASCVLNQPVLRGMCNLCVMHSTVLSHAEGCYNLTAVHCT